MYPFKLQDNETILLLDEKAKLLIKDMEEEVSIAITTNRFIIFKDVNKNNVLKSLSIMTIPEYEIILAINRNDIVNIIHEDNYDKYLLKNTNYFYLLSEQVYNFLKN